MGDKAADKSKGYLEVEQQAISLSDNDRWLIYPVKTQAELDSENEYIETSASYSIGGDRLQSVTDAYGSTTVYGYSDRTGLLGAVTDARENVTSYTYDRLGRMANVEVINDSYDTLAKVYFSYNADDTLSAVSPHSGASAFCFYYDEFGRSTSVEVTDLESARTLVTNRYNSRSLLDRQLYGNGHSLNFVYDALDRLVGKGYNDTAPVFTYGYDLEGRLASANDAVNGIRTRFVYDLAGRLVRTIGTPSGANGFFATDLSVRYNSKNQVTSRRFGIGSTARTVEYTYDDTGRLTAENHDGASLSYSFDALGRLSGETAKNGTKTLYERSMFYYPSDTNSTGTRVDGEDIEGKNWRDWWVYAHDANGNLTEVWRNSWTDYEYTYDDLNQLTTANVVGYTYAYTYDDGGNILTQTKSGLFPTETITYTYGADAWQDLLTGYGGETFTYDEIGNPLTWRNGMTFTWQNGRQLQSAVVGNQSLSFAYNADGIRTKKTVDGVTTRYTLNGTQVLAQQTGTDAPIYFTYDASGRPYSMTCGGTTVYYLCNLSGDVFALLDADGKRIVEYTYGPFGQLLGIYGSAAATFGTLNPLRYRGYYYDTETGLYYLNSRYYDPEVGRFVNADSAIAGVGGSIQGYNMFAYCMNNPVNMGDSTGNWPRWATIVLGAVAAVAAVAVTVVTLGAAAPAAACTLTAVGMSIGASYAVASTAATVAVAATTVATAAYAGDIAYSAVTGDSLLLDTVFQGNTDAYNTGLAITSIATAGMLEMAAQSPGVCFVAGTPVLAACGYIAIEEIKAGDMVWSENPETGEKELKEVVQTFVNETTELIYVQVGSEEIATTPEHPFYSPVKGWIAACKLRAGDVLVLQNGKVVIVEKVQHEILETPITVYNFEVADFHTYYVGKSAVLVHNTCGGNSSSRGVGGKGWVGDKTWRENVSTVGNGGTITSLNGGVPTKAQAMQLINQSGGTPLRIEAAHPFPNPHNYTHINYVTSSGVKGTIKIFE